jgi:hypothetical protein
VVGVLRRSGSRRNAKWPKKSRKGSAINGYAGGSQIAPSAPTRADSVSADRCTGKGPDQAAGPLEG